MSGPKVVRIVTVEEVRELCKGHLARLDAAVAQWEKVCRRNEAATDADIKAVRQRSAEIASLMKNERYLDLQKQAPEEIQWLERDADRRLAEAALRLADARVRARRRSQLATELLQRIELPAELRRDLEAIARGSHANGPSAETVISAALRSITPVVGHEEKSAEIIALAQRMSAGQRGVSLDEWLAAHGSDDESGATSDKIDAAIAGLTVAGAAQEAGTLSLRYRTIQAEPLSSTRRMRVDTLLLDVSKALERQRDRGRQLGEFERALAEARPVLGPAHSALIAQAETALSGEDLAAIAGLQPHLNEMIEAHRKTGAASARRSAVLAALAEVGYEAREGMETGKPADGNLVFRRANNPGMGVEIAGGAGSSRMQVRPVRFASAGEAGDAGKDRDIETLWCTDFNNLRDSLRKLGADLAIERAVPIGATPVMVIESGPADDVRRTSAPVGYRTQRS